MGPMNLISQLGPLLMSHQMRSNFSDDFAMDMARQQNFVPTPPEMPPVIIIETVEDEFDNFVKTPPKETVPLSLGDRIEQAMDKRELRTLFNEIFFKDDPVEKQMLKEKLKERHQFLMES